MSSKVVVATQVLNNPGIGETVRRTRGVAIISSDQAAGVEDQFGALGFIMVNDLALAAGAVSIPGPVTDGSDDGWFVWQPLLGVGNIGANGRVGYVVPFDSKAMRRVEEGFGIAIMVENASAANVFDFALGFSVLSSLL